MESILEKAIQSVQQSEVAYCKFISANDAGKTGSHQSGFHIHKDSWRLIFDKEGIKGANKDKNVTIKWQDDFETASRFIYYGSKTRNEYRLTRFGGKGFHFPFLTDEFVGALLVICKLRDTYYTAFLLPTEEEIEDFFAAFNISPNNPNGIISKHFEQSEEDKLLFCFTSFLKSIKTEFPPTIELANNARDCYNKAFSITEAIIKKNPDREILHWLDAEFQLFKTIENDRYSNRIKTIFNSVEELIETANTILNRRKSRAGKSLELHLTEIFKTFNLSFDAQKVTEDNKKPDFIFPGIEAYHNPKVSPEKLVLLASKTTCKDRWRQIINEADRVKIKHLFTLQQGISRNQLDEMYRYDVCLVVPSQNIDSFPKEFKERILTLKKFVEQVQAIQG
jgi:hypothetical protein